MHYRIHRVHEWQPGPPTGRIGGPAPRMVLVSKDVLEFRGHLGKWHPVEIEVDPIPAYPSTEQENRIKWPDKIEEFKPRTRTENDSR